MDNYFVKPEFILEKFQFKENFKIPSIKDINAESVVDLYENMRPFFPYFQDNSQTTIAAPKLEDILDNDEKTL